MLGCRTIDDYLACIRKGTHYLPWPTAPRYEGEVEPQESESNAIQQDVFVVSDAGFPIRRAHALAELEQLEELPEFFDTHNWALEHLPPDEPSVLIHGDLLGQNTDTSNVPSAVDEGLAVIDWEYAMLGDPAYDLAIVTRASKKPFAIDRGLERLLDAYATFGQRRIAAHEVHFYELCLLARWYRDSLDGKNAMDSVESQWGRVRNVIARARRAIDDGDLRRA